MEYFTHHWKNSKWTPKYKKSENPSTPHEFYVDLGTNRYLDPRDPIIGSMGYGGGVYKLKDKGTGSYPVNECILVCNVSSLMTTSVFSLMTIKCTITKELNGIMCKLY